MRANVYVDVYSASLLIYALIYSKYDMIFRNEKQFHNLHPEKRNILCISCLQRAQNYIFQKLEDHNFPIHEKFRQVP